MDEKYQIRKGFYNRLVGGANDFRTLLMLAASKYKLFYHIAPQLFPQTQLKVNPPFVVFDILPINQQRDTVNKFYDAIVQFRVVGLNIEQSESLSKELTNRLEDSENELIFEGYKTIRITREPTIDLGQIENFWNIIVQYRIQLQGE